MYRSSSPIMLVVALICLGGVATTALADLEPHGAMLRYPDISADSIVFVYANDLWIVPREGGMARPLASPNGIESFPRFSPDGQSVAFVGNYDGNSDLYTIPIGGGVPVRVTHHSAGETLCDWTADGKLLFFSNFQAPLTRQTQLFTVSPEGGLPERLPVPYGANGAISPDGKWLAYTPHTTDGRTWKRYRGGMATDIWFFNLDDHSSKRVTEWEGTDSQPMWHGDMLYYMCDADARHKLNIWSYNPQTGEREQITDFDRYDIKWPAMGPGPNGEGEIIFQNGADLYVLNLATGQTRVVDVTIPGDRPTLRPQRENVSDDIGAVRVSSTGKRAVVEAHGDIWTVPAKNGAARNLTRSDNVHEQDPAWSPDGRWIAYLSDKEGEFDLYLTQSDGKGETRRVASLGPGYRYIEQWSPDSKHLLFGDNAGNLWQYTLEGDETKVIDTDPWAQVPQTSWSSDSRWIAYSKNNSGGVSALWLYDTKNGEKHQLTSGMFDDGWPAFDREGKYLYYTSQREFSSPLYGSVDGTWVYRNTGKMCVVPLREKVGSPWALKSDEEKWEDKDAEKDKKKEEKADEDKKGEEKPAEDADNEEKPDENGDEEGEASEAVADDGVSGVWEGTITGSAELPPEGLAFTLTLKVDANGVVSGSINADPYHGTIASGTYDKETGKLTFTLEVETGEGPETFAVDATIEGGTMTGNISGDDFHATLEGKRTGEAAEEEEEGEEGKKDKDKDKDKPKPVEIEIEGFEERAMELPVGRGRFWQLQVNDKNELIYVRDGNIKFFDVGDDEKKEKDVLDGAGSFDMTSDGKKLLVQQGRRWAIIDARAGQKFKDPLDFSTLVTTIDPRREWEEVFTEVWRIQRDFFYVENMHGVNWEEVRQRYGAMLKDCVSRDELSVVISEMISELNVGHAYYWSGSVDNGPRLNVGLLGVDYELADGAYRIAKIFEGAPWDSDARGPLSEPGLDVKEGDFLLAVNGVELDTSKDPWAAFQGRAGDVVTLTVSEKPEIDDDAREIVVRMRGDEAGLRYRAWVEKNRKYVEEKSDGRVGYIHVPNTGVDGQDELYRQFFGQRDMDALIIDDRWNGGGQIPDRFIELLNRPLYNYWARRHGHDTRTPGYSQQGPKCMLTNGLAGSGGDAFPKYFKAAGLGKLIGMRTWGGLVGISGNPRAIDGTYVTVPTFGYYDLDGTWGVEGHGVDPDIEVIDDPALMVDGGDPQLDAAIERMLSELESHPFVPPRRPESPDRSGMGVLEEDK